VEVEVHILLHLEVLVVVQHELFMLLLLHQDVQKFQIDFLLVVLIVMVLLNRNFVVFSLLMVSLRKLKLRKDLHLLNSLIKNLLLML